MPRFTTDGKFLRRDDERFYLRGTTYGPCTAPDSEGGLPTAEQRERDLDHIAALGFNTVRLYDLPPEGFLDQCHARGLACLIGIPWTQHVDFLDSKEITQDALDRVSTTTNLFHEHPALLGFMVGNEIDPGMVRWLGLKRVQRFLERLIDHGRKTAPGALFAYATYPSTEYLNPRNADFLSFNIFLEDPDAYQRYLLRLHHVAGDRPLVVSEFGIDALNHGDEAQAETIGWQAPATRAAGCAGNIHFAYTDEWWRGGKDVTEWGFGLTLRDRTPRPSCEVVAETNQPSALLDRNEAPKISVLVCTYNGSSTLEACLESLKHISYPNYEVLIVDDGSTDEVPTIAQRHADADTRFRYLPKIHAGLSVARNFAATEATGEILAYIDDDATADPDWLTFLALAYQDPSLASVGGPNIPPEPGSLAEACVSVAPGQPCHVMLDNRRAEHLPGVNLSVRKDALEAIGGFDPQFMAAGDDVDFCWRLIDAGYEIGFAPGAVVWHRPRITFRTYLRQQRGYGKAEAALAVKHRARFHGIAGIHWHGCIYGGATPSSPLIYRGQFGYAPFQSVYTPPGLRATPGSHPLWHIALVALIGIGFAFPIAWVIAGMMFLAQLNAAAGWAMHATLPSKHRSVKARVLLAIMAIAQPPLRGLSRLKAMLSHDLQSSASPSSIYLPDLPQLPWGNDRNPLKFWSKDYSASRAQALEEFANRPELKSKKLIQDDGWQDHDYRVESFLASAALCTVTEYHEDGLKVVRAKVNTRLRLRAFALQTLVIALTVAWILQESVQFHPLVLLPIFAARFFFLAAEGLLKNKVKEAFTQAALASGFSEEHPRQQ